jgi:hypothetical protein
MQRVGFGCLQGDLGVQYLGAFEIQSDRLYIGLGVLYNICCYFALLIFSSVSARCRWPVLSVALPSLSVSYFRCCVDPVEVPSIYSCDRNHSYPHRW